MQDSNLTNSKEVFMLRRSNNTKAEKAYSFLINEILTNKLKVGDRLISERDLALQLNISRITLREALRALCNAGFLKTKRGGGTYVISKNPSSSFQDVTESKFSVLEVLQARSIIEPEAARLAAQFATDKDIEYIKKCKENRETKIAAQLTSDLNTVSSVHDADTDFHRSIIIASHNTLLLSFFDSIKSFLIEHQQQASIKLDMFSQTTKFHNKIYNAILNKKADEAAKTMKMHIFDVEKAIIGNQKKYFNPQEAHDEYK